MGGFPFSCFFSWFFLNLFSFEVYVSFVLYLHGGDDFGDLLGRFLEVFSVGLSMLWRFCGGFLG